MVAGIGNMPDPDIEMVPAPADRSIEFQRAAQGDGSSEIGCRLKAQEEVVVPVPLMPHPQTAACGKQPGILAQTVTVHSLTEIAPTDPACADVGRQGEQAAAQAKFVEGRFNEGRIGAAIAGDALAAVKLEFDSMSRTGKQAAQSHATDKEQGFQRMHRVQTWCLGNGQGIQARYRRIAYNCTIEF